jgi:hypothetical protein
MDFEEISMELFKDCADAFEFDEFLCTPEFKAFDATTATHIGSERLDAHALAAGHNTLDECITTFPRHLSDSLSTEDIIGICERFVDLQVARLDGHSAFTTVLTSIYIQRSVFIENPILRTMFTIFSGACFRLEAAQQVFRNEIIMNSYWNFFPDFSNYFSPFDAADLDLSILPDELQRLASFELALCEYLRDPRYAPIPDVTNAFSPISCDLGIDPLCHYRHSSPKPPRAVPIPTHAQSISLLYGFIADLSTMRSISSQIIPLDSLLEGIINLNDSGDLLNFTRLLIPYLTYDRGFFGQMNADDYLQRELSPFFISPSFFKHQRYPVLVELFKRSVIQLAEILISPKCCACKYLAKPKLWESFQACGWNIYLDSREDPPKCENARHADAAGKTFSSWATSIATVYLLQGYLWSDELNIFTPFDVLILTHGLTRLARAGEGVHEIFRIASAVFTSRAKKTEGEVNRQLKKFPPKPAEILWTALLIVWRTSAEIASAINAWGKFDRGQFYHEEKVFELRMRPIADARFIEALSYMKFEENQVLPPKPNFTPDAYDAMLKIGLAMNLDAAKAKLLEFVRAGGDRQNEVFREAFACVINNRELIGKLTRDGRFTLEKKKHGNLFPCFKRCG